MVRASKTIERKEFSVATTCVKLTCEVGDLFDKALKPDVLDQMKKTIVPLIEGTGLEIDPKCTDGWDLTVKVSLSADDPKNPKTIDADVVINGLHLQGGLKKIKATGGAKAERFSPKKVKEYAKFAVNDAVEGVMKQRVLSQLKP
jgi:hypothetical protein